MNDFLFWTKKALTSAIYPVPVILMLMILALLCLVKGRRVGLARVLLAAACLWLILCCSGLPIFFLRKLEDQNRRLGSREEILAAFPDAESTVRYIVVLGGGAYDIDDPSVSELARLPSSALMRVAEGVRLHSYFPKTRILMSGGPATGVEEGAVMRRVALYLGVPSEDVFTENRSMDTEREAVNIKEIVKGERFFLVTSAWHMPRSVGLFKRQGLNFIPAPTDFYASHRSQEWAFRLPTLPDAGSLVLSEVTIKEYLGILVGKITGKI